MKTQNLNILAGLTLALAIAAPAALANGTAQTPPAPPSINNPWAEFTPKVEVSPTVKAQIRRIAAKSKSQLLLALKDSAGKKVDVALPKLVGRLCKIFADSKAAEDGVELLFRLAIYQGFELVYGVPADESCSRLDKLPILHSGLSRHVPANLLAQLQYSILRDTAEMAITLTETDQSTLARDQGSELTPGVLDLPYAEFAFYRLMLARSWDSRVINTNHRMRYDYLRAIFQQWLNVSLNPNQENLLADSPAKERVEQILAELAIVDANPAATVYRDAVFDMAGYLDEVIGELAKNYAKTSGMPVNTSTQVIEAFRAYFQN